VGGVGGVSSLGRLVGEVKIGGCVGFGSNGSLGGRGKFGDVSCRIV